MKTLFNVILLLVATVTTSVHASPLPLRGGENVLFIGNSLTAQLPISLNALAAENGLPAFNGHNVQIWNETLRTHVLLSPEQTPEKFAGEQKGIATNLKKLGYKVAGANSLFKQGIYDRPELTDRGYLTALEAIQGGTPEGKPWDVIVIQAYTDAEKPENKITIAADGTATFEGPLMEYGAILIRAAQAVGAQPVIYAAWGGNPKLGGGPQSHYNVGTWTRSIDNYQALAEHFKLPLIPVRSAAWSLYNERKPADVPVDWLQKDNVHAAACGNALLHYMMASALYGKPAAEITFTINDRSKWTASRHYVVGETEATHNVLITPELDQLLRRTVDDSLKGFPSLK